MKKTFFFSFLLTIALIASAQQNGKNVFISAGQLSSPAYSNMLHPYSDNYEGIKGSPYLYPNWQKGDLYLYPGKIIKNVRLKYNCYKDELHYLDTVSRDSFTIEKKIVDHFVLENPDSKQQNEFKKVVISLKEDVSRQEKFVEDIYHGKNLLFKVRLKEYIKAGEKSANRVKVKDDEFVNNDLLFLKKKNGNIYKLKSGQKDILNLLNDQAPILKKFIKGHKLNLKENDSLVKLLSYYESLGN